jgi:Uma2 family endonuclease
MDPKPPREMWLAPPFSGGDAPVRAPSRGSFPSLDDHLVPPETREERIRGRSVLAMPAHPPHADRQFDLSYALRGSVKPGYVGSSELLTRAGPGSDFATDACIRKAGTDPATGTRYLEELAFEVINEQSARDIREKAEDLAARGVRRMFAVFVKTGKVCEWSKGGAAWSDLDLDGTIQDECLSRPLRVRALLDAAEADRAVAEALVDKHHPVIEELRAQTFAKGLRDGKDEGVVAGKAAALLAVLAARGLAVSDEARARILGCRDGALLDRWIGRAAVASAADDVVDSAG